MALFFGNRFKWNERFIPWLAEMLANLTKL